MEILLLPLSILLIPYALFLAFYVFWSLILVYHLVHFGFMNTQTALLTALHTSVSLFLISLSLAGLARVDWSASVDLGFSLFPSIGL